MATDTQQIITDHLQFASEVLPEIADTLRLLAGRVEVLTDEDCDRLCNALITASAEISTRLDSTDDHWGLHGELKLTRDNYRALMINLSQPGTRIVLVREEDVCEAQ